MPCLRCFGKKDSSPESRLVITDRLPLKQKLSFASGHVLNDLISSAWFSYLLIFLTKVAGLSNPHAGYVVLSSQIFEALINPLIGQVCDRTVSRYGRRKTWHLIGTVCVFITVPMLFMRCLGCEDSSSSTKLGYYITLGIVFSFGWCCTQIGHLALIPDICRKSSEAIELSALRSAVTFMCGIFIYIVTWILLGQSKEDSLSPKVWKQFMYLGIIIVGTGSIFNVMFHIWIIEPPNEDSCKRAPNNNNNNVCRTTDDEKTKALLEVSCVSKKSKNTNFKTSVCGRNPENGLLTSESPCGSETLEVIDKHAESETRDNIWKDWLKYPLFYKTNLLYTCSRLVINISQVYLPLYLTETLQFEKESIAYFPLLILVSGVLASPAVKPLNERLGNKIAFSIGSLVAFASCVWFFLQTIEGRNAVYGAAILIGSGGSIMLTTSLSMIAQLIGNHKTSGAFVYGTIGLTDKLSSGVVIAIIQQLNPRPSGNREDCPSCDLFIRQVLSITPGCAALFGLILITFFFESIFICKRKVENTEIATQTETVDGEVKRITWQTKLFERKTSSLCICAEKDSNPEIYLTNRASNHAQTSTCNATPCSEHGGGTCVTSDSTSESQLSTKQKATEQTENEFENDLFEKRNFLSSSWLSLEGQAAVRLATYDGKTSPQFLRKSIA